jgi:phosphodiesterase/alkaline phosphatase D-like protein
MSQITRRGALATALLGGAATACEPILQKPTPDVLARRAAASRKAFPYGVASGDPGPDSVVLWTRVASFFGEMGPERLVRWEVGVDPEFGKPPVAAGVAPARASADWTVKVVADGLEPGQSYFYRFALEEGVSPTGRTKTLPQGRIDRAAFAFLSCSNYPFGYFNVYDLVAKHDDIDAVVHLGDYIYEYDRGNYGGETGERLGRPHEPAHEIVTLADYRRRHAQYKADPASQAMHAAHPLIALWDDHETADNSWKDGSNNHDPSSEGEWSARKRAALQAYYEWMPVREPEPGRLPEAIFRAFSYGDLLTIVGLETRLMARSAPLRYDEIAATLRAPEDVAKFREQTLWDEGRAMLGAAQEKFVRDALAASARAGQPWRLLANQAIMADVVAPDLRPYITESELAELEKQWPPARAFVASSAFGLPLNLDAWDGYPAARERLYRLAREAGASGLLVVTGDSHTWWANDLVVRDGGHAGVELGVHSVTSPSPFRKEFLGGKGAQYALLTQQANKSVRYMNGEDHGFALLEVTRDVATAIFMAVDTIETPFYNAFEKARFEVGRTDAGVEFAA